MNPIRAATLSVADLAAAIARYQDHFDYGVVETGVIEQGLADSYAAPLTAGAPYAVTRPSSGVMRDLRLIEAAPVEGYKALRSYGWAAIEICVQDVLKTYDRVEGGAFEVIGPPAAIATLPTIHPMQVQGPDGEIIFLTEIKQGGPGSRLPTAHAPIDSLFICVLACRDMTATAAWIAERLSARVDAEVAIPYRMINRAFSLPTDTLHKLVTITRDDQFFVECDQYPEAATARPCLPGHLAPGVSVVTLSHPDLDSVPGPWLTAPVVREGAIYQGRRVGVLQTPEGALIELVEGPAEPS